MNCFVIAEPSLCIGCNTCMAACSQVHETQGLVDHPRLIVMRDDNSTAPVLCRQCGDAPCAAVCPVNAIIQTGSSVQINESTCIGCKMCGLACPFGAITPAASAPVGLPDMFEHYIPPEELGYGMPHSEPGLNSFLKWDAGVKNIAVKCDLCYFRAQGPACVESCPTAALHLVEETDLKQSSKKKQKEALLQMSAGVHKHLAHAAEGGHHE